MKTLILLTFSIVTLNAQYYGIDKEQTRAELELDSAYTDVYIQNKLRVLNMMDLVIFLKEDSIYIASESSYPTLDAVSRIDLNEEFEFLDDGFIFNKYYFNATNQLRDSIIFNRIKQKIPNNVASSSYSHDIVFDSFHKDFKEVTAGDLIEHTFYFENHGDEPLKIINVKSSCGCTVPQWPQYSIEVGVRDSIIVTYDTKDKSTGLNSNRITIKHNFIGEPIYLIVKAKVLNKEKPEEDWDELDIPIRKDTLTHHELIKQMHSIEQMQNQMKVFSETKPFKIEEIFRVDTLSSDQYILITDEKKLMELIMKPK